MCSLWVVCSHLKIEATTVLDKTMAKLLFHVTIKKHIVLTCNSSITLLCNLGLLYYELLP